MDAPADADRPARRAGQSAGKTEAPPKGTANRRRTRDRFGVLNAFADYGARLVDTTAQACWWILYRETKPDGLARILDRDLVAAGIARLVKDADGKTRIDKRDDRDRTIDVHALRSTFGTHLSKGGVAPRTAQAAMRHGTLELTVQTYTDARLLDVAAAMNVLPDLPLSADPDTRRQRATGTTDTTADESVRNSLVRKLVQASGNQNAGVSNAGNSAGNRQAVDNFVSAAADVSSERQSTAVEKRAKGLEPSTFSLEG